MARVQFDRAGLAVDVVAAGGYVDLEIVADGGALIRARLTPQEAMALGSAIERGGEQAGWSRPEGR